MSTAIANATTLTALPDEMLSTLAEGRQAYVAVPTRDGPHVTPELYAWEGGRLWFASASTTLKSRVLPDAAQAAAVVTTGGRSVLLAGLVETFDLRHPVALACRFDRLPDAALALTRYTIRNAPDLLAFGLDTALGRLGSRIPPARVLFSIEPTSAAAVEGDALVDRWGRWASGRRRPRHWAKILAGGEAAVGGLPGPVAVPGRWFPASQTLRVAPEVAGMLRLGGSFPVSVARDEYNAPGPAAKAGRLIRGTGSLVGGEPGSIHVDADQVVDWHGTETTSHLA